MPKRPTWTPIASLDKRSHLWILALAYGDMRQAQDAADLALIESHRPGSASHSLTYEALSECALVRYARPYQQSRVKVTNAGGSTRELSTKLTESYVPVDTYPEAMTVHHRVLALRDQFFAHSDATTKAVIFSLQKTVADPSMLGLNIKTGYYRVSIENLQRLQRLSRLTAESLLRKIYALAPDEMPTLNREGQEVQFSIK